MDTNTDDILKKYYNNGRPAELKEELIKKYIPLVKLTCGRLSTYTSGILEMDDLCSYGIFGLIDAIDKFDITKNIKFETYASLRIRGAVIDSVRRTDYVPRVTRQKEKEIRRARERLALSGPYTDSMLAEELGMPVEDISEIEGNIERWNFIWLDDDENGEGNYNIASDLPGPESVVDDIGMDILKDRLEKAMDVLTDNERTAVNLVFYNEMTQAEAAKAMDVSPGRVSQLIGNSLVKLKKELGEYSYLLSP